MLVVRSAACRGLDQLHEDAAAILRVGEVDARARCAGLGNVVEHAHPGCAQSLGGDLDVVHAVGDLLDARTAALEELRKGLVDRLQVLGILINRFRPQSSEGDFRVSELREKYGDRILPPVIEERTVLQQAQGAGRPIHGWPGESAIEIAGEFDKVLEIALQSMGQKTGGKLTRSSRKVLRLNRMMRGQGLDEVLKLEAIDDAEATQQLDVTDDGEQVVQLVQRTRNNSRQSCFDFLEYSTYRNTKYTVTTV